MRWVDQDAQRLRRAYANSDVACFAYDGDLLIGAVRGLSDGDSFAVVCDLVVDPDHQGHGVGRTLMEVALARLGAEKVLLASVPASRGSRPRRPRHSRGEAQPRAVDAANPFGGERRALSAFASGPSPTGCKGARHCGPRRPVLWV